MDGEVVKHLGYYFLLCAFTLYISAIDEIDIMEVQQKEEEEEPDNVEDSVLKGLREDIEEKTYDLLVVYLKRLETYKKIFNTNKDEINTKVLKSKEKEKAKVVLHLKDLSIEDREIENIMKIHSLGDWSVGQTRAIFEYDENQYDKELIELERIAIEEARAGITDEVTEYSRDIYTDYLEQQTIADRISAEINDLSHLAEDDDMGDRDAIDYL